MTRKSDLEQHIRESYRLIREYEEIQRTSDRPEEKARARRNIEEQWGLIKGYLAEYVPLCERLNLAMPEDIVEIAVTHPEPGHPPMPVGSVPAAQQSISSPGLQPKPIAQEEPMAGISSDMYRQLRKALLDCGPFGDDSQLRTIFAHPKLRPWRHNVPQAPNPAARVDTAIDFLIERHRADTQENALVLFLRVLSDRLDPADECHPRLVKLADQLEDALGGGSSTEQATRSAIRSLALDTEITSEIEEMVREDQLAEALTRLSNVEGYRREATLLIGRLNRIRKQERRGTMDRNDTNIERTKIAETILGLIPPQE